MSIFDSIKKDNISLRKAKDALAPGSTYLLSKIKTAIKDGTKDGVEPEPTDTFVFSEIRSYIKQLNQTLDAAGDKISSEVKETTISSIEFAKKYLPAELSVEKIEEDAKAILEGMSDKSAKSMGLIIKSLKEKYGDQFDGSKVSPLVKKLFS